MKSCKDCKHADWLKTSAGRLHPSGSGVCTKEVEIPKLPASKSWRNHWGEAPRTTTGIINRHKELDEHCVYWERQS